MRAPTRRYSRDAVVVRNRTFDELCRRLGRLDEIIAHIVDAQGHASVLEIGAGSGIPMHQLHLKFGDRLSICGLNRWPHHGHHDLSLAEGMEFGVFDEATVAFYRDHEPPMYLCADAGEGIPLGDETFDFVYSQASIPFVRDKANLIREVNRVLKPGGSARLQVNLRSEFMLGDTASLFRIEADGKMLSIEDFAHDIDGLTAATSPSGVKYLQVDKRPVIQLNLDAVSFQQVGDPVCPYIESTYRLAG